MFYIPCPFRFLSVKSGHTPSPEDWQNLGTPYIFCVNPLFYGLVGAVLVFNLNNYNF